MNRDPETQAALVAREVHKKPERFDAEPSTPSAFGSLGDLTERPGQCVQAPPAETERFAYMDGLDFEHHLGEDAVPTRTYATVEDCLIGSPCAASCGVVKVRVTAVEWPVEQNLYGEVSEAVCAELSPNNSELVAITTSQIPKIGNREVVVERVGVLPAGTAVDWCAYFRWNDVGDPQGYGHTRDEALAELAETWAEQIGTPDEGNDSPQFDAPSEREMGRA